LYGIVRHPQYTGGLLLIIAMMMVSQHWIVLLAGLVALAAFYPDIAVEDRKLVGMFGRPYELYMKRVPRTNFILGLARAARRTGAPEGTGPG
jgi:protein-S-isoprenylcysteine O-methyltransferase Ste14